MVLAKTPGSCSFSGGMRRFIPNQPQTSVCDRGRAADRNKNGHRESAVGAWHYRRTGCRSADETLTYTPRLYRTAVKDPAVGRSPPQIGGTVQRAKVLTILRTLHKISKSSHYAANFAGNTKKLSVERDVIGPPEGRWPVVNEGMEEAVPGCLGEGFGLERPRTEKVFSRLKNLKRTFILCKSPRKVRAKGNFNRKPCSCHEKDRHHHLLDRPPAGYLSALEPLLCRQSHR